MCPILQFPFLAHWWLFLPRRDTVDEENKLHNNLLYAASRKAVYIVDGRKRNNAATGVEATRGEGVRLGSGLHKPP